MIAKFTWTHKGSPVIFNPSEIWKNIDLSSVHTVSYVPFTPLQKLGGEYYARRIKSYLVPVRVRPLIVEQVSSGLLIPQLHAIWRMTSFSPRNLPVDELARESIMDTHSIFLRK